MKLATSALNELNELPSDCKVFRGLGKAYLLTDLKIIRERLEKTINLPLEEQ